MAGEPGTCIGAGSRRCPAIATIVTILLLIGGITIGSSRPARADEHESMDFVTAEYTYTIDLDAKAVHVVAAFTVSNQVPSYRDGNYVYSSYFDGFEMGVPADATAFGVSASSGSPTVQPSEDPDPGDSFKPIEIDFGGGLYSGSTRDIVVTYDLVGLPPRSDRPWRFNEAFVMFPVTAIGDPGATTVHIAVPLGLSPNAGPDPLSDADGVSTSTDAEHIVYSFDEIADPAAFFEVIWTFDSSRLQRTNFDAGDLKVLTEAWPGDDEWTEFVTDHATRGIPVLRSLIGFGHRQGHVVMRENPAPEFEGYGGWYKGATNVIEVGDRLDSKLLLHELSHMWFDDELLEPRWVTEGLADTYAVRATKRLGEQVDGREQPRTPDRRGPGGITLHQWAALPDTPTRAEERWGYRASWYVIDAIVDEVGLDAMRSVLSAADAETLAYRGDRRPEARQSENGDWRRFLDLAERIGGSRRAAELIERYVAPPGLGRRLEERAETIQRYDALDAAGGEWAVPLVIRSDMDGWAFESATTHIENAHEVLELRDRLAQRSRRLGIEPPAELQEAYEDEETSLDTVRDAIRAQLDATDAVIDATATASDDHDWLTDVGLLGEEPEVHLDAARAALASGDVEQAIGDAREAERLVADGGEVGRRRVLIAAAAVAGSLLLVGAVVVLGRRRLRGRRAHRGDASGGVGVVVDADAGSDARIEAGVDVGIGRGVDLDEDALAGADLGGMDDRLDVANRDEGQTP